ncbi:MAG: protein TolQ [Proteobacteria bacterium]|nr:protein TolQ [Pseudomonadota bacterium]
MIWGAGPVVKLVLLTLLILSVVSWAIIIYKVKLLRTIEKESEQFSTLFWNSGNFSDIAAQSKRFAATPLARLFESVETEFNAIAKQDELADIYPTKLDRFKRVLTKASVVEKARMEATLPFLATTGNTAPFIGLFGTVWGIMASFRSIGIKGVANLAVVAPGISEALIATAVGLFAAIPAVVGYNYLLSKMERIYGEMDNFSTDLLNIVENQITKERSSR